MLRRVLDARQLALKLLANVTYGYTAAGTDQIRMLHLTPLTPLLLLMFERFSNDIVMDFLWYLMVF